VRPTPEKLFEALAAIRSGAQGLAPWRVVDAFVRALLPHERDADARQRTLVAIHRSAGAMRAETPAQAAAWVRVIAENKRRDGARGTSRRLTSLTGPSGEILDVPSAEGAAVGLDEGSLPELLAEVEEALDALLAERFSDPAARILPRAQARSRLLRTLELPLPEIAAALSLPEPPSTATLSKWIERGLPLLSEAIARWGTWSARHAVLAEGLRARVEARRADAGQERPARRRGASVGPKRRRQRSVRPNRSSLLLLGRPAGRGPSVRRRSRCS
jgi:hypothetical protein